MTTYLAPPRAADGRYADHPEIGLARRLTEQARLILGTRPSGEGDDPEDAESTQTGTADDQLPADGGLGIDALLEKQAAHPLNRGPLIESKGRVVGAIAGVTDNPIGFVSFDPSAHPRDYRGRFLVTGDDVDLPDGQRGVVETLNADGTMSVRTSDGIHPAQASEVLRIGEVSGVPVGLNDGQVGVADRTDTTAGTVVVRLPDNTEITAQPADLTPVPPEPDPTNIQYGIDGRALVQGAGVRDAAGHIGIATDVAPGRVTVQFGEDTRTMRDTSLRPTAGTADSEFPSPLDERIVNLKPDRNLADPTKTAPLAEMLPDARYQAYSQVPFLSDLHKRMGVEDPLTHDVADYIRRRDDVFDAQPLTSVPLDHVVVTQRVVNRDRITQIAMDPSTGGNKPAHFVRHNGETYVMNGHHRIGAGIIAGDQNTTGRVLDLDRARADDPTMDPFEAAGPDAAGLPPGIGRGAIVLNGDGHLAFITDASDSARMRAWNDDTRQWTSLTVSDVGSVRVPNTDPDKAQAETLIRARAEDAGLSRIPKPAEPERARPRGALAPVGGLSDLDSLGDGTVPKAAFEALVFGGEDSPEMLDPDSHLTPDIQRAVAARTRAIDKIAPAMSVASDDQLAALTGMPMDAEYALTPNGLAVKVTEQHREHLTGIATAIVPGDDPRIMDHRRRALVSQYISLWAETAGDATPRAIAMQTVANDLFGLTDAAPTDVNSIIDGEAAGFVASEGPVMRAYLTATYEQTQKHLADAGVDSIVAYRGMSWFREKHPDWANQPQADLTWRPMSSWSADPAHASEFSESHGLESGVVVASMIPRDRILSIPSTGAGAFSENELVVLAGPGTVTVVNPFYENSGREGADRVAQGALDDSTATPTWHSPATPITDMPSRGDMETPDKPGGFAWQQWADFYVGGLPSTKGEDYKDIDKLSDIKGTTQGIVSEENRGEAKAAVVADLVKEMELVSDEDMFRGVDDGFDLPEVTVAALHRIADAGGMPVAPVMAAIHRHSGPGGSGDLVVKPVTASGNTYNPDYYDTVPLSDPRVRDFRRANIVNAMVAQWATTSNDGAPESHAIQEIAAEHFKLTDTAEWDMNEAALAGGHNDIRAEIDRVKTKRGPAITAFLQAQYDLTQRRYAEAGITQVQVYRGMGWAGTRRGNNEVAPDWAQVDGEVNIALRPLASWSVDRDTADQFGRNSGNGNGDHVDVLIGTTVPVERILATPRSGVGALNEWEVVVIGGQLDVTVRTSVIPPMTDDEANSIPAGMIDRESDFQTAVYMASTDERRKQLISRARDQGGFWKMIPPEWNPDTGLSPDGKTFDGAKDETPYEGKVVRQERASGLTIEQIEAGTARDLFDAISALMNGRPNTVNQSIYARRKALAELLANGGFNLPGVNLPDTWANPY